MSQTLRILILEDSESDAELTVHEMRRAGYTLDWKLVQDEANFIAALEDAPDIILADYSLPQFDALKALEILTKRGIDIPFIIVSGSIGEEIAVAAMKRGATDYLIKDRMGRLPQAVAQALAQKQLRDAKREAEEALHETRDRLELALWGTDLGVWDWQLGNSKISINQRWAEMLGYDIDELEPSPDAWKSRIHPDDQMIVLNALRSHLEGETSLYEVEHRLRTRQGDWVWILSRGRVVERDRDGRATRITGTHQDISERKAMEEQARSLEIQMQHGQKLESLGVLAGGIAHDFNNLLLAILGNAGLAQMELGPGSPVHGHLDDIEKAAQRAADLCKQLLAYSGKGRFVVQPLDVNQVVQEMTHLLEVSISKKAVLKFRLQPDLPAVMADATQIRQIFMNLVTNASDAIGEKSGVITITTGVMDCDQAYLSETFIDEKLNEGRYVYFEVVDSGCGMDRQTQAKIFDPFFTTKFTGRGLGMAAVLGIIRGHHGAIRIYSEVHRGSTFKVLLPAVDHVPSDLSEEPAIDTAWKGEGTLLVVDDEESIRVLARKTLERAGFRVLLAEDGREGLRIYREHPDEIRLVLLDVTMPHLDGQETYRELRRIRKDVCVILSSGYNEKEATEQFAGKGLAGFIQKPYRPQELLQLIRTSLERPNV